MKRPPLPREEDINPDGVLLTIRWEKVNIGVSIFVPCIDLKEGKRQLRSKSRLFGWECKIETRIEEGKLGLRMWRTL